MPKILFTAETAAEMGKRGQAALKRNKANPQPADVPLLADDLDRARRLARVRRQLALVDARLTEELLKDGKPGPNGEPAQHCDGQLVNWLASAQFRLSDQEFALANRPKPAQAKVAPARTRSTPLPPPTPSQPQAQPVPTTGSVPPQPGQ